MKLTRRHTLYLGGGAAVLIAAGAGGRLLLRKRYAPSPYDDLLALPTNRDAAAQIGETVLAEVPDFDSESAAGRLRRRIHGRGLAEVAVEDAETGRLLEAGGWVVPETLGLICALAAKAAA